MDVISISDLCSRIEYFFRFFFSSNSASYAYRWGSRFVDFIVSDPLIMAVAAIFFVGIVVAFFMRVYHSI